MSGGSTTSPLGLRLIHAAVFVGLAVVTAMTARGEVEHLVQTYQQPYTVGAPARIGAVVAGACAVVGGLWLCAALLRNRSAPAAVSLLIGLSFAFCGLSVGRAAPRPDTLSVNLALLEGTRGVQHELGSRLQREGVIPDTRTFTSALEATRAPYNFEVRDRQGRQVPLRIVEVRDRQGPLISAPGEVWLLREGGGGFALRPVGVTPRGEPQPLLDAQGRPLWLEATYQLRGPLLPKEASP